MQREDGGEVVGVGLFGPDQRLPHAAGHEHADKAGEDLDRRNHAEVRRHQQTSECDAESELEESAADLAEGQPLDTAADALAQAHVTVRNRSR